jgi:hypothetical protein
VDQRIDHAYTNLPTIRPKRHVWDKGRIVGQKRPLLPKHVWAIRVRFEIVEGTRRSVSKWLDDPVMVESNIFGLGAFMTACVFRHVNTHGLLETGSNR